MFFPGQGLEGEHQVLSCIADLILLYNKCMEGQYGKGDIYSFDLYNSVRNWRRNSHAGTIHVTTGRVAKWS
jgi:hypothetical protein